MKATIALTANDFEVSNGLRVTRVRPFEGAFLVEETFDGADYAEVGRCTTFSHAVWMALQAHSREYFSAEKLIDIISAMPPEQQQEIVARMEELRTCKVS